ncbi:CehA/McbA family metallohydrolase [Novosphingobium sp. P6W]|uniref:CehA/McbA family metallohydrolase n=1 Tax=Novosphingobium sp. P6W TaxID=1609758 RepID=UPI0009E24D29|nr:CehA/McbA family metallohydrolase [Novosphingobium sp. P6W]AXB79800.1 PHP domain-containing protein [Novosphingobium sp. P6W]
MPKILTIALGAASFAALFWMTSMPITAKAAPAAALASDEVVMSGTFSDKDAGRYLELPFEVPAGVTKMSVDVDWEGRGKGVYLVLGLYDPERSRGWGGLGKPSFVVAEGFATPSYQQGPLVPGTWKLSIAVASIRPGMTAPYTVKVHFDRGAAAQEITLGAVKQGAGWYRGDFHTHTGHSDGQCMTRSGAKPVPCPVYFTLKAAADNHLDFVSVTDHNVTSHISELNELAPWFDGLLVIPGREMTTQFGHSNFIGLADFAEFRVGMPPVTDINTMFDQARGTGALISINHPAIPTDENCIGCGWSAPGTDFSKVNAIEVANGGRAAEHGGAFDDGKGSGTAWWEALLDKGFHLTAIGGSDNHDAIDGNAKTSPVGAQAPVGTPATVVYASDLSQAAILAGVRSGRVLIDTEGSHPDRMLDIAANLPGQPAVVMGGTLQRTKRGPIKVAVHVKGMAQHKVDLIVDGQPLDKLPQGGRLASADETVTVTLPGRAAVHWIRADVRAEGGRRVLIGNPIYVK